MIPPVALENDWRIPIETELDWRIAVSTAPARTPRMGLENIVIMLQNCSFPSSTLAPSDIISIPNISVAKPSIIMPIVFFLSDLQNISITTPTRASIGVKVEGLNRVIKPVPSTAERLISQLVAVVPIFAPIITPIA